MYRTLIILMTVLIPGALASAADARKGESARDVFIKVDCPAKAYVGQAIPYAVYVYSTDPEIGNVSMLRMPDFGSLEILQGQAMASAETVAVKGKTYYRWNISRNFIVPSQPGSFSVAGALYDVSIGERIVYNDPFWGRRSSMRYTDVEVSAPDINIKVKKLPDAPSGYSDAVGEFSVETTIPPGRITRGSDAVAIVRISGYGLLGDADVADISRAFAKGGKFKSATPSKNIIQRDGRIYSELLLECVFTPREDLGVVDPVSFVYFDPDKGCYRTAKSEAVNWQTTDTTQHPDSRESMAI